MTTLELAAECFAAGDPVLVAGPDGDGAVVAVAAAQADAVRLGALHELGSDMVVLGLEAAIVERLELTPVARTTRHQPGLRLATPVDAADCPGSGWSLPDRAHTIRTAVAPGARAGDLTVPGHVHTGVVDGHATNAPALALELARVAGHPAAVLVSAVRDRDGRAVSLGVARRDDRLGRLPEAPVEALYGRTLTRRAEHASTACALPTRLGDFRIAATAMSDGAVTLTLIHGDPASGAEPLVRTHQACLLGDTFRSLLCDCHLRLERAAAEIRSAGAGILVYVKPAARDPFACPRSR